MSEKDRTSVPAGRVCAMPAMPQYVVSFRPDVALLQEIALVVTGLDVTAITEPPQRTLSIEQILMGLEIALEQSLAELRQGFAVQRASPGPAVADAPVIEVTALLSSATVPDEVRAQAESAFAAVRAEILGGLRAYRDSRGAASDT
jgi:hypothetical protein